MLSEHLTNLKQRIRITVVDPSTRSIQGVLRDGATVPITVWEVPAAFVWPEVNEQWTVRREAGMWLLGQRIEAMDEEPSIDDLAPGQGKLDADTVIDRQGRTVVTVDISTLADGEVAVWDADTKQFIAGAGGGGGPHTHPISDVVGLQAALDLKAPLASPTFTGDPKAPTPATADNDTSIATTAFVKAQGYTTQVLLDAHKTSADHDGRYYTETEVDTALALKAALASPAFTGNPTAPTPAAVDNDTSIATTAFVKTQGYLLPSDITGKADLASPTFTGDPKAPTPATADNDTSIATTAFVKAQGYLLPADITGKADLASPTLTGDPKAPTPVTADNDTSIATTAFVKAQGYATAGDLSAYLPLAGGSLSGMLRANGGQSPLLFGGDIDTAKWLVALGGFKWRLLNDHTNTASNGSGDKTVDTRTYRPKLDLSPDGTLDVAGPVNSAGVALVKTNDARLSDHRYPVAAENLRTVRGRVDMSVGGPTILQGTGFTVSRTAVGVCVVTASAFTDAPAVVASVDTSVGARIATVQVQTVTQFTVRIWNGTTAEDRAFDFIACGPG